jgi:hypothetical protein
VPFRVADKKLSQSVSTQMDNVARLAGNDPVTTHIMKALVYEQNQCYGNAFHEYVNAVEADTTSAITELFSTFLTNKVGLSRSEALMVLKKLRG